MSSSSAVSGQLIIESFTLSVQFRCIGVVFSILEHIPMIKGKLNDGDPVILI